MGISQTQYNKQGIANIRQPLGGTTVLPNGTVLSDTEVDDLVNDYLGGNSTVVWSVANTSTGWGTLWTMAGTAATVLPTTTSLYTNMRRASYASVVTTANQQIGVRSESQFVLGNVSGMGGAYAVCKFGLEKWTANDRLFVGFVAAGASIVTGNPSTQRDIFGFGIDAGDTAITLMHNDGAGTATKDTISGQPTLATGQGYMAYLWFNATATQLFWRLDDMNSNRMITQGMISTDLPTNTTYLGFAAVMSNGANVVAGDATLGIGQIYIRN